MNHSVTFTRPDTIDPATIHLSDPNRSVKDNLRWAIQMARSAAVSTDQYVLIHYEEKNEEPNLKFVKHERKEFESLSLQCPRAADALYAFQEGHPRPVPSIAVYPDGQVVVSKPSLCEGCSHDLSRRVQGHCSGRKYQPLIDMELPA